MGSPASARHADAPLAGDVYRGTLDCVHCGLCLPVCPTYRETGSEVSSPRGRVFLMRGVAEGQLSLAEALAEEAYLCLGCRACETACPSGVEFGRLLEATRAELELAGLRRGWGKRIEAFALRRVIPRPQRLRRIFDLLGLVQRLRLDRLLRPLLPRALRELQALAPRVPPRAEREPLPEFVSAQPPRRGRVGLFVGCVMPELFGAVNHATVRVLARNGFDVVVARGQVCCGALHAHAGDLVFARRLARRNIAAFEAARVDAVVVNSAGCGAAMREAGRWLPDEGEGFASRVRDVCEWLEQASLRAPLGQIVARVCYDDPCHLLHGQRVREAPRRLLRHIPGLALVEHDDPGSCCGAAGIYNLTHREMAAAVSKRKLESLRAADADIVASGNPGCLIQLRAGAARSGLRARIVHPVELLDEAHRLGEAEPDASAGS
jgi:glycolate oxidase iron-sulfur subunit